MRRLVWAFAGRTLFEISCHGSYIMVCILKSHRNMTCMYVKVGKWMVLPLSNRVDHNEGKVKQQRDWSYGVHQKHKYIQRQEHLWRCWEEEKRVFTCPISIILLQNEEALIVDEQFFVNLIKKTQICHRFESHWSHPVNRAVLAKLNFYDIVLKYAMLRPDIFISWFTGISLLD